MRQRIEEENLKNGKKRYIKTRVKPLVTIATCDSITLCKNKPQSNKHETLSKNQSTILTVNLNVWKLATAILNSPLLICPRLTVARNCILHALL